MSKNKAPVKPSCATPIPLNTLDVVGLSLIDKGDAKKEDITEKIAKGNFLSTGKMLQSYKDSFCPYKKGTDKFSLCIGPQAVFEGIVNASGENDTIGNELTIRPYVRGTDKPEAVLPLFFVKAIEKDVVTDVEKKTTAKQDAPDTTVKEPLKYGQKYYIAVKKSDAKKLLMSKSFDKYREANMPDGQDGLLFLAITPKNTLAWSCVDGQIATWTIALNESVLSRQGSVFQAGKKKETKEDYPKFAEAYKEYVMAGDLFSLAPTKSGLEKYVFSSQTVKVSENGAQVNVIDLSKDDKLESLISAFVYKPADDTDKKSQVTVKYDLQLDLPGQIDDKNSVAVHCNDALQDSKTGLRICDNGQWSLPDSDGTVVFDCEKKPVVPDVPDNKEKKSMLPVWAWVLIALGSVLLIGVIVSAVIGMTDNPLKARFASMAPLSPITGSTNVGTSI